MDEILIAGIFLTGFLFFFFPAIIAIWKKQDSRWLVLILNVAGGWTGFGWLLSLIMAFSGESKREYNFSSSNQIIDDEINRSDKSMMTHLLFDKINNKKQEIDENQNSRLGFLSNYLTSYFSQVAFCFIFAIFSSYAANYFLNSLSIDKTISLIYSIFVFMVFLMYPLFEKLVIIPEQKNKMNQKCLLYKKQLSHYIYLYVKSLQEQFSEKIHSIGLMTCSDLLMRLPELPTSIELAQSYLEEEVRNGYMSKIDLKDGEFLYKSKKNKISELASCETVHLDIT